MRKPVVHCKYDPQHTEGGKKISPRACRAASGTRCSGRGDLPSNIRKHTSGVARPSGDLRPMRYTEAERDDWRLCPEGSRQAIRQYRLAEAMPNFSASLSPHPESTKHKSHTTGGPSMARCASNSCPTLRKGAGPPTPAAERGQLGADRAETPKQTKFHCTMDRLNTADPGPTNLSEVERHNGCRLLKLLFRRQGESIDAQSTIFIPRSLVSSLEGRCSHWGRIVPWVVRTLRGFELGSFGNIARNWLLGASVCNCVRDALLARICKHRSYRHGTARRSLLWHSRASSSPTHSFNVPRISDPQAGHLDNVGTLKDKSSIVLPTTSTTYDERQTPTNDEREPSSGRTDDSTTLLNTKIRRMGTNLADVGHKFGRSRAQFGGSRAQFGEIRTEFGRARATIYGVRCNFGRCRANVGRIHPNSG